MADHQAAKGPGGVPVCPRVSKGDPDPFSCKVGSVAALGAGDRRLTGQKMSAIYDASEGPGRYHVAGRGRSQVNFMGRLWVYLHSKICDRK